VVSLPTKNTQKGGKATESKEEQKKNSILSRQKAGSELQVEWCYTIWYSLRNIDPIVLKYLQKFIGYRCIVGICCTFVHDLLLL
jgi:hypothetical protein